MTKLARSAAITALAILSALALLAGCTGAETTPQSSGSAAPDIEPAADQASDAPAAVGTPSEQEPVAISVSNLPPTTEPGVREAFLSQVEAFEAANPHITIEPNEYEWDVATFAANLAGGTLPTVIEIPFTDIQGLIARGQVADISTEVDHLPYADDFNPNVLAVAQDADGAVHGLPIAAYGIGLHYNRALYAEAGLDPDSPPTTWEEVREHARTIAEETGQAGYAQMSQGNTGGWMLTALTYALGGRMQTGVGDDIEVTVDNPATKQALQLLHDMRWSDDAMGDNFLYDWGSINQAFAAGTVGMYMGGSDVYNSLVTENGIDPDTYGVTVLPLEGEDAGVLGGGSLAVVRADASEAERAAAVAWIDHFYLAKLTDEAAAVADAEALATGDAPIGTPTLPIFDAEQLATAEAWVADHVNVPLAQMAPFKDQILSQPLVPEPAASAQEMYAALDSVVQAVLTDQGADIDALLTDVDAQVTALVEQG